MSLQVIVPTCDKYVNLMPGFFHQWEKYCGLKGMMVYETIAPDLPLRWAHFKAGYDTEEKGWAGNLLAALGQVHSETVLLVLDDYWLTKEADTKRIHAIVDGMMFDLTIDKVDLTNDRIGFPHVSYSNGYVRSLPLAPYLTSTQAAIWRTEFLRDCLHDPSWSPWQFELIGSERVKGTQHKVLGCRVPVMHYANVMLKGESNPKELYKLSTEDVRELAALRANIYLSETEKQNE